MADERLDAEESKSEGSAVTLTGDVEIVESIARVGVAEPDPPPEVPLETTVDPTPLLVVL